MLGIKQIPVTYIILDLIGAVMVALGLIELFIPMNFLPESFRFTGFQFVLIFTGLIMTVPLVMWLIKFSTNKNH